jgi:D-alanyl-D-alanine carboxypeptidase
LREFPAQADLFNIGALQLGNQYIANHNGLLGRYPGTDEMKTGFTCPAGFNVVASANHSGRRLIVVVLGAPTAKSRNQEAANLFDRGFAMGGGSGSLESLPSAGLEAPDMRADICLIPSINPRISENTLEAASRHRPSDTIELQYATMA